MSGYSKNDDINFQVIEAELWNYVLKSTSTWGEKPRKNSAPQRPAVTDSERKKTE